MGHTHYWRLADTMVKKDYEQALFNCRKIVRSSTIPLEFGVRGRDLVFNGVGEDGHEEFVLEEFPIFGFNFCKTARKPYDLIVVACLCVLNECTDESPSSDGDPAEWEKGRAFAEEVLGRKVTNPLAR